MILTQRNKKKIRQLILKFAKNGAAGHLGPSLSLVEIFDVLIYDVCRFSFSQNEKYSSQKDILALSKGHGAMCFYAYLLQEEILTTEDLTNYLQDGSHLFGLIEADGPYREISGGSLGHGFPVCVGMALGLKYQQKIQKRNIYCIVGDGEMNEGSIWEAILVASHHKLSNLTMIVDYNKFQAMGETNDIINLEPFVERMTSFGFATIRVNGHETQELLEGFYYLNKFTDRPKCLIADTIKGKGISFMEKNNIWHYQKLDDKLYQTALSELEN